ncbi:MAG: hypothetical protein KDB00_00685 [Planctomycetales bacterium]|nr:hypothetical protein [Planctomycetales bacterium]
MSKSVVVEGVDSSVHLDVIATIFGEGGAADRNTQRDGLIDILIGVGLADGVASNPINPFDVNNDSLVSPLDALHVINFLARQQLFMEAERVVTEQTRQRRVDAVFAASGDEHWDDDPEFHFDVSLRGLF